MIGAIGAAICMIGLAHFVNIVFKTDDYEIPTPYMLQKYKGVALILIIGFLLFWFSVSID